MELLQPDLIGILEYVHRNGEVLPGTNLIPGQDKFYYSTNGKENHDEQSE